MKKIFLLFLFCVSFWEVCWYEYSGFSENTILNENNRYVCDSFCLIKIDTLKNIDELVIEGNFTWSWNIWVWVPISWNIQWIYNFDILWSVGMNESFSLEFLKKQIPLTSDIYVYYQWNIDSQVEYIVQKYSLFYKIQKQLFSAETFAPYSINLRYGKSIGDTSIIYFFYIIFFVIVCFLVIFWKFQRTYIFIWALILYGIVASINLWSFYSLYISTEAWYVQKQNYHNMWDYFAFTDGARKSIWLDNFDTPARECTYHSICRDHWPFCYYLKTLYFKPCRYVDDPKDAQYIILHKTDVSKYTQDRKVIHSHNGSYLLK